MHTFSVEAEYQGLRDMLSAQDIIVQAAGYSDKTTQLRCSDKMNHRLW